MTGKAINAREAKRFLNDHGFFIARVNGSHAIYKDDGGRTFTMTTGAISQKTWKRECKRLGLMEV